MKEEKLLRRKNKSHNFKGLDEQLEEAAKKISRKNSSVGPDELEYVKENIDLKSQKQSTKNQNNYGIEGR